LSGLLGAATFVASLGFIALQGLQFVGRLLGDPLGDRFGQRTVVQAGGVVVLLGMGAALAAPTVVGSIAGFALAGLGIATLIPAAMRGADEIPGLAPGVGLTLVSWLLRVGFLVTRPLLGAGADATSLRVGFLVARPLLGAAPMPPRCASASWWSRLRACWSSLPPGCSPPSAGCRQDSEQAFPFIGASSAHPRPVIASSTVGRPMEPIRNSEFSQAFTTGISRDKAPQCCARNMTNRSNSEPSTGISRRSLIIAAGSATGAAALTVPDTRTAHAAAVRTDPFALGVAAGDPLPDRLMLWTRLVKDPLRSSSMPARDVTVQYEVSTDSRFRTIVKRANAVARASLAHSVHVDVGQLKPHTEYHYRFRVGNYVSPAGRARTAPARNASPSGLRFAIANCQDYQNGYWPAYTAMAAEELDFVLHLGDYIYEYDPKSDYSDRRHTKPQINGRNQLRTLSDYRARHAQYKLDPALQAAHANAAWIVTWDDHEVENNYANAIDEINDKGVRHQNRAAFRRERAAGYQAYYEHMPIRVSYTRGSSNLRLYRHFDFGDLARVNVLDTRQYRTDQPAGYGRDVGPLSAGRRNTKGTLTGATQETWLKQKLSTSHAHWNVIAQQVMMGQVLLPSTIKNHPIAADLDAWDGYATARTRLLRFIDREDISNPVVLAGDIHSTWMNNLVVDPTDPHARTVASEFVSTSISSNFSAESDRLIKAHLSSWNPRTRYYEGSRRGYLRVHVNRERWLTEARTVRSIAHRKSPVSTTAKYAVENQTPGIVRA
jgi:alkaline phosphatase D